MRGGERKKSDGGGLVPQPERGRRYGARRSVRLSDAGPGGRLRLDAIARYLQDVASDDVADAGWRSNEHLWLIRRTEIHVLKQPIGDEQVALTTWASGVGVSSAARRTTLTGDRGGLVEAESIWVHLDRNLRPARLQPRFLSAYNPSTLGRRVTPRLDLRGPEEAAESLPWPLRASDLDLLGHVNNASYWQAVEQVLALRQLDMTQPVVAMIEFRGAVDLGDEVTVRHALGDGSLDVGFTVEGELRAAARVRLSGEA